MAALGKRSTAPEEECNLDPWGQPWITDSELEAADWIARDAPITPIWLNCTMQAGLLVLGSYENSCNLAMANEIVKHANKQRIFLAKKNMEEQQKEMQERSTAKKQKTEEDSDTERDCSICECEKTGMAVACMCDENTSRYVDHCDCKACAFEQKSSNLHVLRHTCGGVSNIHLDWRLKHDEGGEKDEGGEGGEQDEKE